MRYLRRAIVFLLLALSIFFNIERLDFGQENLIDIQSFVYVLALMAVLAAIWARARWSYHPMWAVGAALVAYLFCKALFFTATPVLGGVHTYITITEFVFLGGLTWLGHEVGRGLRDFEAAVENITQADINRRVKSLEEAAEDVQLEFIRSRRHHRPLTVVVLQPDPDTIATYLHRTVREIQQAMMNRYVLVSMARVLGDLVRRGDLVINQAGEGRFVILCPDTTPAQANSLLERIRLVTKDKLGVVLAYGVTSFPVDAPTYDELVHRAEAQLQLLDKPLPLVPVPPVEDDEASVRTL